MRGKLIIFDSVFQFFHWKTVAFMLYCIKISAVLFLQNYCVLLQGVYNIIVDNTGAARLEEYGYDKARDAAVKMTATRVRMGIIEATHGGKKRAPGRQPFCC